MTGKLDEISARSRCDCVMKKETQGKRFEEHIMNYRSILLELLLLAIFATGGKREDARPFRFDQPESAKPLAIRLTTV